MEDKIETTEDPSLFQDITKAFKIALKRDLTEKALTSARLCQLLGIKMTGCGVSINWCRPRSLRLGNMDQGASYRLLEYGHCTPIKAVLEIYCKDGMWRSKVLFSE